MKRNIIAASSDTVRVLQVSDVIRKTCFYTHGFERGR
jgi:hypothetical protein